jgi:ABC-type molybdate transport system substrate-binding protein
MGRLIVVLAVAGVAAVAVTRPGSNNSRAHSSLPTVSAASAHSEDALAAAKRDFEKRQAQAEVGLVGAAPLFGAEGLPKPAAH